METSGAHAPAIGSGSQRQSTSPTGSNHPPDVSHIVVPGLDERLEAEVRVWTISVSIGSYLHSQSSGDSDSAYGDSMYPSPSTPTTSLRLLTHYPAIVT